MADKVSGQLDLFAGFEQSELSDDRHHSIFCFKIKYDIAVLFLIEKHIVNGAFHCENHFRLHEMCSFPNK